MKKIQSILLIKFYSSLTQLNQYPSGKSILSRKIHSFNKKEQRQGTQRQSKQQSSSETKYEEIILEGQLPKLKKQPNFPCIDLVDSDDEKQGEDKQKPSSNQPDKVSRNQIQSKSKLKQQIIEVDDSTFFIPFYKHKNYQTHIKDVLTKLSKKQPQQLKLQEIVKAITYFREQFMVHRQNRIITKKTPRDYSFQIINNFHSSLAKQVFSKMVDFLLEKESDPQMYKIPIFESNRQLCQTISKWQALFVMCCMTMCLIIEQKSDVRGKMYRFTHFIEFTTYFSSNEWKTRCILQYLKTQLTNYYDPNPKPTALNNRQLTIKRVICPIKFEKFLHNQKDKTLKSVNVTNDDVTVDDFYQELKLCHTNEVLGGGQYLGGLSQEDIFFSAHTELHILLVLCEQMNISDCVNLVGFRKYFRIERTKYEITFDGQDKDYPLALDQENRIKDYISFVNHPKIMREQFRQQFKKQPIDRQLAIYYSAIKSFMSIPYVKFNRVISAHWACLIQWGDPRKKITSLWMASSMNDKVLTFCPYGEFKSIYDKDFFFTMKEKKIRLAYEALMLAGRKMMIFRDNLHVFMLMVLNNLR